MKTNPKGNECQVITCLYGTYPVIYTDKSVRCDYCHPSCETCNGPYSYDCIKCRQGYYPSIENKKTSCLSCPKGYKEKLDGSCKGIFFLFS